MTECSPEAFEFHSLGRRERDKGKPLASSSTLNRLALTPAEASAATMRANPLRLYFASFAHVLLCALRRLGLSGTEMARAECGTI